MHEYSQRSDCFSYVSSPINLPRMMAAFVGVGVGPSLAYNTMRIWACLFCFVYLIIHRTTFVLHKTHILRWDHQYPNTLQNLKELFMFIRPFFISHITLLMSIYKKNLKVEFQPLDINNYHIHTLKSCL